MPSRAIQISSDVAYGLIVFLGTAGLGFVVLPTLCYAAGLIANETDARAAFSSITLKAVPVLFGFSAAAALSNEWLAAFSIGRRVVAYLATTLLVWIVGAASAIAM